MTTSAERKAQNEGAFREANETLEERARATVAGGDESLIPFLCECPRIDCTRVVLLMLAEYEQVRADGRQGIAHPGHEDPEIERVLDRNDRFVTTRKEGRPGEVHADADPRGND